MKAFFVNEILSPEVTKNQVGSCAFYLVIAPRYLVIAPRYF